MVAKKINGVFLIVCMLAIFALVYFVSAQTANASGEYTCNDLCQARDENGGQFNAGRRNQCIAIICRGTSPFESFGIDIDLTDPNSENPIRESRDCANRCVSLFSATGDPADPWTQDGRERSYFLTTCVGGCYPPTIYGPRDLQDLDDILGLTEPQRESIRERAATHDAQTRGLCLLKSSLSKSEVESLLVRDIAEEQITNVNIEVVAPSEDERNVLCTYSSIKLILRYMFFIVGVVTLLMLLFAGFLWITSRGETQKVSIAKKVLLAALVGFVIVLLVQAMLQILRSLF